MSGWLPSSSPRLVLILPREMVKDFAEALSAEAEADAACDAPYGERSP